MWYGALLFQGLDPMWYGALLFQGLDPMWYGELLFQWPETNGLLDLDEFDQASSLAFQGRQGTLPRRGEYNVYSTFQSHEPEFDYLKSLEIEEKINKIRWLKRANPAHFLLSTNGELGPVSI